MTRWSSVPKKLCFLFQRCPFSGAVRFGKRPPSASTPLRLWKLQPGRRSRVSQLGKIQTLRHASNKDTQNISKHQQNYLARYRCTQPQGERKIFEIAHWKYIGYIHDTCMKIRWAARKVTSKCIPQDFDFVEVTTWSVCRMTTMTAMTLKRGLQRLLHSASFLVAARRGLPPCQTVHRKHRWSAKSMCFNWHIVLWPVSSLICSSHCSCDSFLTVFWQFSPSFRHVFSCLLATTAEASALSPSAQAVASKHVTHFVKNHGRKKKILRLRKKCKKEVWKPPALQQQSSKESYITAHRVEKTWKTVNLRQPPRRNKTWSDQCMVNASDVLDKCALRDFASWIFMDLHGKVPLGTFYTHILVRRWWQCFRNKFPDQHIEHSFEKMHHIINENQHFVTPLCCRTVVVAVVSGSCVSRPVGRTQLRSAQGLLLRLRARKTLERCCTIM